MSGAASTGDFHHYVPTFLLKRFRGAGGKLHVLDIQSKNITDRPVKKSAGEDSFYAFSVPEYGDKKAEDILQKIESDAARCIKKICNTNSLASITVAQRKKLSRFIAIQSFRTKSFFDGLSLSTISERRALFAELLRSAFLIQNKLETRDWFLMPSAPGTKYYIGDHPVTLQYLEDPGQGQQLGIGMPGVEVFFPMSPTLSLWIPPQEITDEIVSSYENACKIHREVRHAALNGMRHFMANPLGIAALQRAIFSGKKFHQAKYNYAPIVAEKENMENFNSLQIMFSSKEVYSCDGDFEFALRVLNETPSFAATLRTSLTFGGFPNEEG